MRQSPLMVGKLAFLKKYKADTQFPFPIDLVYLWIDGSSPEFNEIKNKYLRAAGRKENRFTDAIGGSIYRDNDELKYSLRSVSKNAPWVNHIYIVTGFGQVPNWLNTGNPRVTVIPQESILPPDASPVFNSCAIEASLANIPGLAEHFILANDDMFFNASTPPDYFFDYKGRAKFRYNYRKNGHLAGNTDSIHQLHLINAAREIERAFGLSLYKYKASHGMDPYIKSSIVDCLANPILAQSINATRYSRFRDETDVHRLIFNLYDVVHGRARLIRCHGKHVGHNTLLDLIYNLIHYRAIRDSGFYCVDALESNLAHVKARVACINDSIHNTDENRKHNWSFFESKFPNKSEFEN